MRQIELNEIGGGIGAFLRRPEPGVLFLAFDAEDALNAVVRESSVAAPLRLSDFCKRDSTLNSDALENSLARARERTLVLGVGEYLALTGDDSPLRRLWGMRRDLKTLVVPVWNGYRALEKLSASVPYRAGADPVLFVRRSGPPWRYKKFFREQDADFVGFQAVLRALEYGYSGELKIFTRVALSPDWGENIDSYAGLYNALNPDGPVSRSALNEEQWQYLIERPETVDRSFFGALNFLELKKSGSGNEYLNFVLANTESQAQFRKNFLELFLTIKPEDGNFPRLAAARRELLPELDAGDLREFVARCRALPADERINYLTDHSEWERREIIKIAAENPRLPARAVYKKLADYLDDYVFAGQDPGTDAALTAYFKAYKQAKLENKVTEEVVSLGREHARLFYKLPARGLLVEKLAGEGRKLHWLDALGCEYLAFIENFARENSLSIRVRAAQAKLPSITTVNRDFYDAWPDDRKSCEKALDHIKHGDDELAVADKASREKWPLHLSRELEVLNALLERIARELKSGQYEKAILTSDHGATRLAVISRSELIWETPEKGKYGGRCCPRSTGFKPAAAVCEGDWLALTDYSRFKGSHAPSVEVHGGATLEEVVVPVIEFSLGGKKAKIIQIRPPASVALGPRDKFVEVEITADLPLIEPRLRMKDKFYSLARDGDTYQARLPVAELGDDNEIWVYADGEKLESAVRFRIERGVSENKFDDFF